MLERTLLFFCLITLSSSQLTTTTEVAVPKLLSFNLSSSTGAVFHIPPTPHQLSITLNLCSGPLSFLSSLNSGTSTPSLYVSNSSSITSPGPAIPIGTQHDHLFPDNVAMLSAGFANVTLRSATDGGAWIGVWSSAESDPDGTQWSWQLGISTTSPFHVVQSFPSLIYRDSDANRAEFSSISSRWIPFAISTSPFATALSQSLCALQLYNQTSTPPTLRFTSSISDKGLAARQSLIWRIDGLEKDTNYTVWSVDVQPHKGGVLAGPSFFKSKSSGSCFLPSPESPLRRICPDLTYAIPSPVGLNETELASLYVPRINASQLAFATTLSTFACNTRSASDGTYSFISTCKDCTVAYNRWVCSVGIPRCTDIPPEFQSDFNSSGFIPSSPVMSNVYPRTDPASSRTPFLAEEQINTDLSGGRAISPFPYGEVLPCDSVCQMVAAKCPPFISWNCPLQDVTSQASYGRLRQVELHGIAPGGEMQTHYLSAQDRFGNIFCNSLGTDVALASQFAGARIRQVENTLILPVALLVMLWWYT